MNGYLVLAATLLVGIGIAHSWLGEWYIITRLLRKGELPKLFGDDVFTRRTLRFAWHLTTVAWFGFATVLLVLAGAPMNTLVSKAFVLVIGATFVGSAVLSFVFTRGRHLSWIVFLAIAVLCFLVS